MRGRPNDQRRKDRSKVWLKYEFTPEMNTLVRAAFYQGKGGLKNLWRHDNRFEASGIPYPIVKRQCKVLGLVRALPGSGWSKAEDEALSKLSALRYSPERLTQKMQKAGYDRTWCAIQIRLWKLGWDTRQGRWSPMDIAVGLGVDHTTVLRWIDNGYLKAKRTASSPGSRYFVSTNELRRFLSINPYLAATGQADVPWIIYVLSRQIVGLDEKT